MNVKVHYLLTAVALMFLGLSIASPGVVKELRLDKAEGTYTLN